MLLFYRQVISWASSDSQVFLVPELTHPLVCRVCRSQRGHGLPDTSLSLQRKPRIPGVEPRPGGRPSSGTLPPPLLCSPSPSLSLCWKGSRNTRASLPGDPDCHHSCSAGILESVNWAGHPAPGPTVSRNELGHAQGSRGRLLVSSTGERVQETRADLWAVATPCQWPLKGWGPQATGQLVGRRDLECVQWVSNQLSEQPL